jgi:hypothetical protein
LRQAAVGEEGDFQAIADKVGFDTKDNAADEIVCGRSLKAEFKNMIDLGDTTHSMQLIIKHAYKGEPEVQLVQEVLLTNKKPFKSVSGLLKDSSACRSTFTKVQQGDGEAVLQHMGWSAQRMSSRHKPNARASLRPGSLFEFLATRAEAGGDDRAAAEHNLRTLAPYRRMMLTGMMADLTWEHRLCVKWSDTLDPAPEEVMDQLDAFLHKARILFTEGLIMGESMKDTFTAQIVKFYREPKFLQVYHCCCYHCCYTTTATTAAAAAAAAIAARLDRRPSFLFECWQGQEVCAPLRAAH